MDENVITLSGLYGLAVEHSAHDRKVMGSIPMLDGNGFKTMPGSIPAPNPGSYNNWKEWKKAAYKIKKR